MVTSVSSHSIIKTLRNIFYFIKFGTIKTTFHSVVLKIFLESLDNGLRHT